jgi:hypothetical protein
MEAAQVSLLRWLRRQLRQPTPLREHLEAAVENNDPGEARRLVARFEFSDEQRRNIEQLLCAWERTLDEGAGSSVGRAGGFESQGRRFDPCPAHLSAPLRGAPRRTAFLLGGGVRASRLELAEESWRRRQSVDPRG